MKKLVIGSTRSNAGKTSIIAGLAKVTNKSIGYIKPFGDRLLYRKKNLWDYDSALINNLFDLSQEPKDMSIGFEHSKLRFMYDEAAVREKLLKMIDTVGQEKELLIIEGGKDLTYGLSVHLDPISVAKYTDSKLILIVSGDDNTILDDIAFIQKQMHLSDMQLMGVIINKVQRVEDFKETYLDSIVKAGVKVFGVIPYKQSLTYFTMSYLVDPLFAKVISGENALNNVIENILVGAMSFDALLSSSILQRNENNLIITSGERSDIILAALEGDSAGIILTNNTLPHANIVSKAIDRNVPMLLVSADTYQVARSIDRMIPLLIRDSITKIKLIEELVWKYVNTSEIIDG